MCRTRRRGGPLTRLTSLASLCMGPRSGPRPFFLFFFFCGGAGGGGRGWRGAAVSAGGRERHACRQGLPQACHSGRPRKHRSQAQPAAPTLPEVPSAAERSTSEAVTSEGAGSSSIAVSAGASSEGASSGTATAGAAAAASGRAASLCSSAWAAASKADSSTVGWTSGSEA